MIMALTKSLFFVVLLSYTQQFPLDDTEGYYWRDYKRGVVPKDALPGGTNANGNPTYIGQILHNNILIPGKIDPEEDQVTYEWGHKEHIAYKHIKIFCTKHPEQFEWLDTGDDMFGKINPDTLVVGGFEHGADIYIGRKQIDNELVLGKVLEGATGHTTLNTSKNGTGIPHYSEYQVLTFKPDKVINQLQPVDIDTRVNENNSSTAQHVTVINFFS